MEQDRIEELVMTARFAGIAPTDLFRYWTEPDLLAEWWPLEAEVDARPGGEYHLSWPPLGLHLRGRYTQVEAGARLSFTWRWDHAQDTPDRQVSILFQEAFGNTWLTLTHSGYDPGEAGRAERQDHLDGWMHFLGKLQDLVLSRDTGTLAA